MTESTESRTETAPPTTSAAIQVGSTPELGPHTLAGRWLSTLRATSAAAAMMLPSKRAAMLAGGLCLAAAGGLVIGTVFSTEVGHTAIPSPWTSTADEMRALKQNLTQIEQQIAGIKAAMDAAGRAASTQHTRIAERHEQATRTQSDMQTRLAKVADTVERLEKRIIAAVTAETTGSTAQRSAAPAAPAADPQPSSLDQKTPAKPQVVEGWVIRDVYRGRALVQSRRGLYEAAPGVLLPELGRVESISRQDGRWVVTTARGLITDQPRSRQTY